MTKKDYELIAEVFCNAAASEDIDKQYIVDRVAKQMAIKLEEENPRFDRDKFLKACGVETNRFAGAFEQYGKDL